MALIDPDDDALMRYVIWHYRFDRARRERRNVTLAAYDNEKEFLRELQTLNVEPKRRQAAGEAEVVEHIGGVVKPPGLDAEQRRRRTLRGPRSRRARERKRHRGSQ